MFPDQKYLWELLQQWFLFFPLLGDMGWDMGEAVAADWGVSREDQHCTQHGKYRQTQRMNRWEKSWIKSSWAKQGQGRLKKGCWLWKLFRRAKHCIVWNDSAKDPGMSTCSSLKFGTFAAVFSFCRVQQWDELMLPNQTEHKPQYFSDCSQLSLSFH